MLNLFYSQVAQTYLHAVVYLSIFSLFVVLVCSLYASFIKFNDDTTSVSHIVITNAILGLNLIVQSMLALIMTFLLTWSYSSRRQVASIDSAISIVVEPRLWGFMPHLSLDFFGSLLICLAFFIGTLSILVSDTRLKLHSTPLFVYFHIFIIVVLGFTMLQSIYTLFICYELLLLPSFLFVLFGSYTNKAVQASLYFVIWTQIGSFLVFSGVVYTANLVGSGELSAIRAFKFKPDEAVTLYTVFFFGFGLKVPIWPFHYWLTKTHVEAPSGFSIYLSGFLVKTALYGFFKITNVICYEWGTGIFVAIAIVGVVDASLKLWGQSDLKKIVAYCTVQEMNLILLMFLLGDTSSTTCGAAFSVAHAFLSALMFFLVDCVYRRCHTRSVFAVHGLLQQTPNLAIAIIIMCVLYAGLPGTLKFTCEVNLLITMAEGGLVPVILILFAANIMGVIGFSKNWFNVIFGLPSKELDVPMMDLSLKEICIILYIVGFFFLANGMALLIF